MEVPQEIKEMMEDNQHELEIAQKVDKLTKQVEDILSGAERDCSPKLDTLSVPVLIEMWQDLPKLAQMRIYTYLTTMENEILRYRQNSNERDVARAFDCDDWRNAQDDFHAGAQIIKALAAAMSR